MKNIHQYLSLRFLHSFCPPHLLEEIEGDLLQKFERDLNPSDRSQRSDGYWRRRAKRRLLWNVIRFFRPGILLRNKFSINLNQTTMFQNYFKTTYRQANKNKLSFAFKLGGLTLALFSFLIIAMYVTFQWSFDKFHRNYPTIYRVNSTRIENDKEIRYASVPSAMGAAMKAEIPEVQAYTIVSEWGWALIRYNDKLFRSSSFVEAESSIFDVFTFEFISGDKSALTKPDGIVLTETLAKQLFGSDDPMQKLISFPDRFNLVMEVRGVIKDLPANSSFDVKAIFSFGALRDKSDKGKLYSWDMGYGGNLYVQLNEHAYSNKVEEKIKPLLVKNLPKSFDHREENFRVFLQPLSKIYFGEPFKWEFGKKGNAVYLYVYISLAVFLLGIAVINYLNLSIADFSFRNKEIGVRKVLGARKKQIVFQITCETIFHCVLALTVSVSLLYFVFPYVSQLFDVNLRFSSLRQRDVLLCTLVVFSVLIVVSSAYPAYSLSINNPIHDLKKKQLIGGNLSVNNILLLAQFVISVFCISATWVVSNQLTHIQTKDIGFNRDNLLEVFMPDRYPLEKAPVLKQEIAGMAGVQSASFSYYHVTGVPYFNAWYKVESENEMKQVMLNELFVDQDYISAIGLTLLDGRNFRDKNEFKTAFIINESAAKEFGWTDPIGKKMAVGHDKEEGGIWSEGSVIGVVRDFHTLSLHKKIEPLVMRLQYDDWPGFCLNVRYSGSEGQAIASIKKVYEKVFPGFLVDYDRVKDRYDNQYAAEHKAFVALQVATWIILLISSIGIFSMSLFLSFKRQKEFGIRKVLGASVIQIIFLHLNHFLKIGVMAGIVALPVSYFVMQLWLNGFAYQTNISSLHLVSVGLVLFVFVTLSAGYAAWKSGRMNPVDVIKME